MAQYTVNHSCGHDQTHQLYGKHKDRERKIEWLQDQPCTDCWKSEQEKSRAAENAQAKVDNAAAGLPALTGSDRQIAWAESIRAKALVEIGEDAKKLIALLPGSGWSDVAQAEVRDALALIASEPARQTEARWWIDRRDNWTSYVRDQLHRRLADLCPTAQAEREARRAAEEASRGQ